MALPEAELLMGRRAFPKAQELFEGVPLSRFPLLLDVGWHGTETHPETGAFAVIGLGGDVDLIGEVLKITANERSIFVYVLAARAVPTPVSVTRRAFLALGLLPLDSLPSVVEVVA